MDPSTTAAWPPDAPALSPLLALRLDAVTAALLALLALLGPLLLRYSRSYLAGDPGRGRHARWMLATLGSVAVLVVTDHLGVLLAAWVSTSLCLHQLLTHFSTRPQALMAAHKKFLVSRVADLCLLAAVVLLGLAAGSLRLSDLHAWARQVPALPLEAEAAAVLLVLGACLKSAQLPFHGWLTQVMEAPTPVSALLHAGVVNIGGFLMLRLSPLMARAEPAQTLLVLVGAATAVVAALVATTRVSVKVALAWSTIAQMGFMLVQCGLGAYSLALLHLLAHSLYKAHAFLAAGSTVDAWRARALLPASAPAPLGRWLLAAPLSLLAVAAVGALAGVSPREEPALWALCTLLALSLTPLLVRAPGGGVRRLATLGLAALGIAALSFTWHALFGPLLPATPAASAGGTALRVGLALAAFLGLFLVQAVLAARPGGALARALHPLLFAGLFLDERFTRLTFRLWPPRLPPPHASSPRRAPAPRPLEA
jgi:NAD(P)H-quinone oxidoreductase subunit 5